MIISGKETFFLEKGPGLCADGERKGVCVCFLSKKVISYLRLSKKLAFFDSSKIMGSKLFF